jgi:hypothetical protein
MAVKIYIVKIYDPLRQCSNSKVPVVWCERADDSGKWRSKLKGEKRYDNSNQQQQAEDVLFTAFARGVKSV